MAKGLFIGGTDTAVGKNMFMAGLGLHLQKEGVNFGYMKPIGTLPENRDDALGDEDALFIQDIFGFNNPSDLVSPVLVTQDFKVETMNCPHKDYMPSIRAAYNTLSKDKQLMLVGGSGHCFDGKYCNLDAIRIIKELGLKAILIDRIGPHGANQDLLLILKEMLGDSMLGVILNDVPQSFASEVENVICPFFEQRGIPVYGVIQSDPVMRSIRADELAERLGGRLVSAQDRAARRVENFLIGTMQVENFMTYFRRQPNSAVLVGGDRADVQLVAIEGECPCIVLTGNLFPNDIILSRADTLKIPIIMVRDDTYTVAKKMDSLLRGHKMRDITKVRQATQLVKSSVDLASIMEGLGL